MRRWCAGCAVVVLVWCAEFSTMRADAAAPAAPAAAGWADDPVWHDGLAEKAVYAASRVVYHEPRAYEAVFFTNKEQHDRKTLTKAEASKDTIEVWKFNQVEV